jgi:hypothetical protein
MDRAVTVVSKQKPEIMSSCSWNDSEHVESATGNPEPYHYWTFKVGKPVEIATASVAVNRVTLQVEQYSPGS